MQLDLSNNGELSIEDSILIDKIAPEVQNEYNKLVENLISDNALCSLDLLLSVVSRDPHRSSVLLTLCKILLLEKKLKNGDDISLIIIESPMLIPTINSSPIDLAYLNNSICPLCKISKQPLVHTFILCIPLNNSITIFIEVLC